MTFLLNSGLWQQQELLSPVMTFGNQRVQSSESKQTHDLCWSLETNITFLASEDGLHKSKENSDQEDENKTSF